MFGVARGIARGREGSLARLKKVEDRRSASRSLDGLGGRQAGQGSRGKEVDAGHSGCTFSRFCPQRVIHQHGYHHRSSASIVRLGVGHQHLINARNPPVSALTVINLHAIDYVPRICQFIFGAFFCRVVSSFTWWRERVYLARIASFRAFQLLSPAFRQRLRRSRQTSSLLKTT